MTWIHSSYGKVWFFDEPESDTDIKASPALEMLIEAGIVKADNVEFAYNADSDYDFEFELQGPWQGSDYSGDDVTESNQRSLVRDFPDLLIDDTRYWGHCGYGLQITPDFGANEETAEDAEELARILAGLVCDYPLYDEQDNGELIHERAQESWDSWVRSDLESDISERTGLTVDLDDAGDAFWDLLTEHDIYPEAEGHRDVVFRGIGDADFLDAMARHVISAGGLDWDEVYDLEPEGYELVGDYLAEEYAPIPGQMAIL